MIEPSTAEAQTTRNERIASVPDYVFSALVQEGSIDAIHAACIELADRIKPEQREHERYEDFVVFATVVTLIAGLPNTVSDLCLKIGPLHWKGRPDTTKLEIAWSYIPSDADGLHQLLELGGTEICSEFFVEIPVAPTVAKQMWTRFALEMRYECATVRSLFVRVPRMQEAVLS